MSRLVGYGPKMKKLAIPGLILIAGLTVYLVMRWVYFVHPVSPQNMTRTAISETVYRMYLYGQKHHAIPRSLDVLPVRSGYLNNIKDGWGRELIMEIDNEKIVTLKSFGKDGMPDGDAENQDIIRSYWLKKSDGSLWLDDKHWLSDARISDVSNSE